MSITQTMHFIKLPYFHCSNFALPDYNYKRSGCKETCGYKNFKPAYYVACERDTLQTPTGNIYAEDFAEI